MPQRRATGTPARGRQRRLVSSLSAHCLTPIASAQAGLQTRGELGPQSASRTMTRELSMPIPNALRRMFLAGAASLLLAAASPAGFAAGVLKIAHEQDVTTFDPILTIQNADIWVMDNMNAGLVRVTNDGTGLEPDLAESWTVSPDAKTYTFKLRDGLKFSDGSPLTAQDVKFSLER